LWVDSVLELEPCAHQQAHTPKPAQNSLHKNDPTTTSSTELGTFPEFGRGTGNSGGFGACFSFSSAEDAAGAEDLYIQAACALGMRADETLRTGGASWGEEGWLVFGFDDATTEAAYQVHIYSYFLIWTWGPRPLTGELGHVTGHVIRGPLSLPGSLAHSVSHSLSQVSHSGTRYTGCFLVTILSVVRVVFVLIFYTTHLWVSEQNP